MPVSSLCKPAYCTVYIFDLSLGLLGNSFSLPDLEAYLATFRPDIDAQEYANTVDTAAIDGASIDMQNPTVEASLDVQTVAGIIAPLTLSEIFSIGMTIRVADTANFL